jgi:hypothetical protein
MLGRQGTAISLKTRSMRSGLETVSRIAIVSLAAVFLTACQIPRNGHQSQAELNVETMPPGSGVVQSRPIQSQPMQSQPMQSQPMQSSAVQPAVVRIAPSARATSPNIIAAATQSDTVIGPAARLTGDPKELLGLDYAAVLRALGDPLWVRKEQPAEVWQYATADCIVDLYLYDEGGALKVTFVEARSHKAEAEPTARCLKSLLERPTASAN